MKVDVELPKELKDIYTKTLEKDKRKLENKVRSLEGKLAELRKTLETANRDNRGLYKQLAFYDNLRQYFKDMLEDWGTSGTL